MAEIEMPKPENEKPALEQRIELLENAVYNLITQIKKANGPGPNLTPPGIAQTPPPQMPQVMASSPASVTPAAGGLGQIGQLLPLLQMLKGGGMENEETSSANQFTQIGIFAVRDFMRRFMRENWKNGPHS